MCTKLLTWTRNSLTNVCTFVSCLPMRSIRIPPAPTTKCCGTLARDILDRMTQIRTHGATPWTTCSSSPFCLLRWPDHPFLSSSLLFWIGWPNTKPPRYQQRICAPWFPWFVQGLRHIFTKLQRRLCSASCIGGCSKLMCVSVVTLPISMLSPRSCPTWFIRLWIHVRVVENLGISRTKMVHSKPALFFITCPSKDGSPTCMHGWIWCLSCEMICLPSHFLPVICVGPTAGSTKWRRTRISIPMGVTWLLREPAMEFRCLRTRMHFLGGRSFYDHVLLMVWVRSLLILIWLPIRRACIRTRSPGKSSLFQGIYVSHTLLTPVSSQTIVNI